MFNERVSIHMGIGEDSKGRLISPADQIALAKSLLSLVCQEYGGASLTRQEGAWADPRTGRVINEPGVTLVAYSGKALADPERNLSLVRELLALADQSALIIAVEGKGGFAAATFYADGAEQVEPAGALAWVGCESKADMPDSYQVPRDLTPPLPCSPLNDRTHLGPVRVPQPVKGTGLGADGSAGILARCDSPANY